MARRRSRRRRSVTRTVASQTVVHVGGFGNGPRGSDEALARRVHEAAEIIADDAKADAAAIPSKKIPQSIHVVQSTANSAVIIADAPNARPIELGLRHPLFGEWMSGDQYTMKQRRFLENGAVIGGDEAADAIAEVCYDWARELGMKPS